MQRLTRLWSRLRRPGLLGRARATVQGETEWHFGARRRASVERLRRFKDVGRGQRCFIIGNGPSLNQTDLSLLRGEVTFGLNRAYLLFPRIGFPTTYLVSVNELVIEQSAAEIEPLSIPKFISWHARNSIRFTDDMMLVRDPFDGTLDFSHDPTTRIWEGATVTYVAMQLAFYMGYKTVILIGVDHSFVTKGEAHKVVVSGGADPNHFDPNYFGKGYRWQLPDLDTSEQSYRIARAHFEADGREIIDATVGGKLQVFPKVEYASLFAPQGSP